MTDLTLEAAVRAAKTYGATDGTFTAAHFSAEFAKLADCKQTLDGAIVRAMLAGCPSILALPGGSHFRLHLDGAPPVKEGYDEDLVAAVRPSRPARAVALGEVRSEGRDLVVYSGGADSTLLLDRLASQTDRTDPVIALAVDHHPQLNSNQLEGQRYARFAYLQWAEKHGRKIKLVTLGVHGPDSGVEGVNPQALVWFSMVMPYVRDRDCVHLGYIKADEFWHGREVFETAFKAVCALKGIAATLHYDLEWSSKLDVVSALSARRVPKRCVWTCEEPRRGATAPLECGRCEKCKALRGARKAIRPEPGVSEVSPPRLRNMVRGAYIGDAAEPRADSLRTGPRS